MKKNIKFIFLSLILVSFFNLSAFSLTVDFNNIIDNIGSKISNFIDKISNESNNDTTEINIDEDIQNEFDNLFINIKTSLVNTDIDSVQDYIVKDIKYKSDINYTVNRFPIVKNFCSEYFDKINYKIKKVDKKSDGSILLKVDISTPDIVKLSLAAIPSIISNNIFKNKLDLNNPSNDLVEEIVNIFVDDLKNDKQSYKTLEEDFTMVRYNDNYKIETINNIISDIENSIGFILKNFNK